MAACGGNHMAAVIRVGAHMSARGSMVALRGDGNWKPTPRELFAGRERRETAADLLRQRARRSYLRKSNAAISWTLRMSRMPSLISGWLYVLPSMAGKRVIS